jgi:hypothetical protein
VIELKTLKFVRTAMTALDSLVLTTLLTTDVSSVSKDSSSTNKASLKIVKNLLRTTVPRMLMEPQVVKSSEWTKSVVKRPVLPLVLLDHSWTRVKEDADAQSSLMRRMSMTEDSANALLMPPGTLLLTVVCVLLAQDLCSPIEVVSRTTLLLVMLSQCPGTNLVMTLV